MTSTISRNIKYFSKNSMKFCQVIFRCGVVIGMFFSSSSCIELPVSMASKRVFFEKLKARDSDYVKESIKKGFPVDSVDAAGCNALHYIAEQKDLSLAQLYIEKGVPVDHRNEKGETALFKAVRDKASSRNEKEAYALVVLLLGAGSDVHTKDTKGFTPLDHALAGSYATVVNLLIDRQTLSSSLTTVQPACLEKSHPQGVSLERSELLDHVSHDVESSESSEDVFPECAHHSVRLQSSRKLFYKKLAQGDVAFAQNMLLWMAITSIAEDNKALAYSAIERLMYSYNIVLRYSLGYFGMPHHIDRICTIDEWYNALMVIFFDELQKEMLVTCPLVKTAQKYAEIFLQNRLLEIVEELTRKMIEEKPAAFAGLKDQLAQLGRSHTFQEQLQSYINSKIVSGPWKAQSVSIFFRLEVLEKAYFVTYPSKAVLKDTGGTHAEKRRRLMVVPDTQKEVPRDRRATDND